VLPVSIQAQYYDYPDSVTPTTTSSVNNANAISTYNNDIRDYSAAVNQSTSGAFSAIICEAAAPTTSALAATNATTCTSGNKLQ